jgi:hypothetical protein
MNGKPDSWPATGNTLLLGDPGVLLRVVGAAEFAYVKGEEELFCAKYGLREKVHLFILFTTCLVHILSSRNLPMLKGVYKSYIEVRN